MGVFYQKTSGRKISRETFQDLVKELSPWISPKPDSPNYRAILANKKSRYYTILPERYCMFLKF